MPAALEIGRRPWVVAVVVVAVWVQLDRWKFEKS